MRERSRPEPGPGERVDPLIEHACDRMRDFWRPTNALRLGRPAGVEVWVHRGWPVGVLLLRLPVYLWLLSVVRPGWSSWTYLLLAALTTLLHEAAGVLPHELAHAAAARLRRREVGPIVLDGAAAAAPGRRTAASPRSSPAIVALAGPLATLALAGLWWLLARTLGPAGPDATPLQAVLLCLYAVELLQGVLSLVAVGPLDGAVAPRALRDRGPTGQRRWPRRLRLGDRRPSGRSPDRPA